MKAQKAQKVGVDSDEARIIARNLDRTIEFYWYDGQYGECGVALPCGCTYYRTVLSNGTIGLGEWQEECSYHFFENRN